MTIAEIKQAIDAFTADFLATNNLTEDSELTEAQNVAYTDGVAGVLETVNPNHSYPPTNK